MKKEERGFKQPTDLLSAGRWVWFGHEHRCRQTTEAALSETQRRGATTQDDKVRPPRRGV